MNGLYSPEQEKERVQEIRSQRKSVRLEKSKARKEKREKYKRMYKEELAKQRGKLQAQKEKDIEVYRTKQAMEKAQRHAKARVKPFSPRKGFKMPSKARLQKAGQEAMRTGKDVASVLRKMERAYSGKPTKRTPTKRKYKKKSPKRKGKSYYCRKCRKRHSYTSAIGKKHRR